MYIHNEGGVGYVATHLWRVIYAVQNGVKVWQLSSPSNGLKNVSRSKEGREHCPYVRLLACSTAPLPAVRLPHSPASASGVHVIMLILEIKFALLALLPFPFTIYHAMQLTSLYTYLHISYPFTCVSACTGLGVLALVRTSIQPHYSRCSSFTCAFTPKTLSKLINLSCWMGKRTKVAAEIHTTRLCSP